MPREQVIIAEIVLWISLRILPGDPLLSSPRFIHHSSIQYRTCLPHDSYGQAA